MRRAQGSCEETDLDALTAELVRVVDERMQPHFVGHDG
jgi:hypothetical protein